MLALSINISQYDQNIDLFSNLATHLVNLVISAVDVKQDHSSRSKHDKQGTAINTHGLGMRWNTNVVR